MDQSNLIRRPSYLPRFGLRILFGAITVAALPCIWWNSVLRECQVEQRAIERIRSLHRVVRADEQVQVTSALGGFVEFDFAWCGPRILSRWSTSLPQFERVVGVQFVMEHVGPQTTDALSELQQLRSVFLQDIPRAKELAAIIRANSPACKVGFHPDWEVTLPAK